MKAHVVYRCDGGEIVAIILIEEKAQDDTTPSIAKVSPTDAEQHVTVLELPAGAKTLKEIADGFVVKAGSLVELEDGDKGLPFRSGVVNQRALSIADLAAQDDRWGSGQREMKREEIDELRRRGNGPGQKSDRRQGNDAS